MRHGVIIILPEVVEEAEAVGTIDLLRRAGIDVTVLGLSSNEITGSHGIVIKTDGVLGGFAGDFDALVLPGGPGHKALLESEKVLALVKRAFSKGLLCAAICAAPKVFGKAGILKGKKACCYPGCESMLEGAQIVRSDMVRDGNVITGRGVGTVIPFALEIITYIKGKTVADAVADAILWTD
jgi:4-methyl-5(b-hydroxyethyl)-thiazole monophosphate biosynthesis